MRTQLFFLNREPIVLLLSVLLWLPSLRHSYFLSDDFVHLIDWGLPPLQETTTWFYREYAGFYRPLTALWWKSQFYLWGLKSVGYQLTNLALHTACAFLVRDIARQTFPTQQRAGLWAGLIFLFLPGHIFGVLMISALTGLLCSLFYLAAAAAYLRSRVLLSLLGFVLALLTKELALSLALLVSMWELVRQHSAGRINWLLWLRTISPYALLSIIYLAGRYFFFGHLPHSPLHENAHPLRLFTNAAIYTAQMVIPWGLQDLKPFFRSHPDMLLSGAVCGLALGILLIWRGRSDLHSGHLLALLWVGISIAPVIRLYSPWNTYLPSVGISLLMASLATRKTAQIHRTALGIFLCLSILYSLYHQQHWSQARALCRQVVESVVDTLKTNPGKIYIANLPAEWAGAPLLIGDWVLQKALQLHGAPNRASALFNVVHFQRREPIEIRTIEQDQFDIKLLTPPAFFRLEIMDVLSGQSTLRVGYTFNQHNAHVSIMGIDAQQQTNHLRVDMRGVAPLKQIWLWNGVQLAPLSP
jgi:hypothetical protein